MAPTLDKPPEAPSLEEELHQLEEDENKLESRASTLELNTILIALLGGFALIFSIAALAVALIRTGGNNNGVSAPAAAAPAATGSTGMGSGMMGGANQTAPVVGGAHVITAQLGEMFVRPSVTSVPAGKVTFQAKNIGKVTHELMVERMPMKFDSPGHPTESAAQGMIEDMDPGRAGKMTLTLKPGKYMLFCNVPGHYAAGQHTVLTVTRS
jgi:uncharacterized cupredoxin-like copper-binding protein